MLKQWKPDVTALLQSEDVNKAAQFMKILSYLLVLLYNHIPLHADFTPMQIMS